jgi:hypothetical protein
LGALSEYIGHVFLFKPDLVVDSHAVEFKLVIISGINHLTRSFVPLWTNDSPNETSLALFGDFEHDVKLEIFGTLSLYKNLATRSELRVA